MLNTRLPTILYGAVSSQRFVHVSPVAYKTVKEKVGEIADKVNKSVGKGLADAIDKGEKATHAAKDTIASVKSKKGAEGIDKKVKREAAKDIKK